MIATDSYPDYDGLTIYTTKRASAAPAQQPSLTVELMLQVLCCLHVSKLLEVEGDPSEPCFHQFCLWS
jgi:hypothetical protein